MYTELAKEKIEFINKHYPQLKQFYQDMMGNFEFSKQEMKDNLESILSFIEDKEGYFLMFQNGYFYLTDFHD